MDGLVTIEAIIFNDAGSLSWYFEQVSPLQGKTCCLHKSSSS
jgi:hypothetical protein